MDYLHSTVSNHSSEVVNWYFPSIRPIDRETSSSITHQKRSSIMHLEHSPLPKIILVLIFLKESEQNCQTTKLIGILPIPNVVLGRLSITVHILARNSAFMELDNKNKVFF